MTVLNLGANNYIYKKTETGEMINMDTIEQEMEQEDN